MVSGKWIEESLEARELATDDCEVRRESMDIRKNDIVQVMTAPEFESIYGKKFSDKTEVAVIHLQYSKPSYVLAALDNMKTNIGKIIIDDWLSARFSEEKN